VSPFVGPTRHILLACCLAAIGWALVDLFSWRGLVGLSGALGVGLYTWWTTDAESRATKRRLAAAFGSGRNPLPSDEGEADRAARAQLGRPSADRWGLPAVLIACAIACGVVAVVRGEAVAALPAVPLVVSAAWATVVVRQADVRAHRWLAGRAPECDPAER
jgi:hypothetical protein